MTSPQFSLLAIEHPKQIDLALKYVEYHQILYPLFIALTPHVAYALSRRDLDYNTPEDFHTEEEINDLGNEILGRLDTFCYEVDLIVKGTVPAIAECDLDVGSLAWYEFKLLVNSVAIKAYIFEKITQSQHIDRVYCYDTVDEPIAHNLFFLKESVWSKVIYQVCRDSGISIQTYGRLDGHPKVNYPVSSRELDFKHKLLNIAICLFGDKLGGGAKGSCN